jgi:IrrE N-terminal-like domain
LLPEIAKKHRTMVGAARKGKLMNSFMIENTALEFWEWVGQTPPFPRNIEDWLLFVFPLDVERISGLTIGQINDWAQANGSIYRFHGDRRRRLRGCIFPRRNRGTIFIDADDSPEEQRYSAAHEGAHFLFDYHLPRERALSALGEGIRDVLDGKREPSVEERLHGVLADVHVGVRGHLMERPDEGVPISTILDAEDRADRLALELLAPAASLSMRMLRSDAPTGYRTRLACLTEMLYTEYGLPRVIDAFYAEMLLHLWGEPTFQDWLFEE